MYEIRNVDVEKAIEVFRNNGYEILIFFLFDYTLNSERFAYALAERFEELNQNTGWQMAFLTKYAVKSGKTTDYITDNNLNKERGWINKHRNEIQQRIRGNDDAFNAYDSMRSVAKAFECGMENRLPCFVILNPNNPSFFVEKSAKNIDPENIFREASHIIADIQSVNYDIQRYATEFNEPYYYLSAHDMLEQNLQSIQYGINVRELKEVINSEKLQDSFDIIQIDELSSDNGYIPIKRFFENLHTIKCRDIQQSESAFIKLIDKYASFFWTSAITNNKLFPKIESYIESSSVDYLKIAGRFTYGAMASFQIKSSMIAICLGKIVEDELNLGIFNVFRGALKVTLPQYYDKVQKDLATLKVEFQNDDETFFVEFNKSVNRCSCKLKYPEVNRLRKIAFDKKCQPIGKENLGTIQKAKEDIDNIKKEIKIFEVWDKLLNNLATIAWARNEAIHRATPLSENELQQSIRAFEYLVKIGFFEVNNKLKKIVRN